MDKSLLILRVKLNCGTVRIMNNKEITKPSQSKIIEEIIPGSDKEKERGERRREAGPAYAFCSGIEIKVN